jgi:hypothetical protein
MPGGAGPAPITFFELASWMELTGIELEPWEVRVLRTLSRDYVAELARAEKLTAKAPWQGEATPAERAAAARAMRDSLRAMAS